jgi:hypothetical protein
MVKKGEKERKMEERIPCGNAVPIGGFVIFPSRAIAGVPALSSVVGSLAPPKNTTATVKEKEKKRIVGLYPLH